MSFSANPLSLSVPESAFDSWLRDCGYLEILDQRTFDLHRLSTTTTTTTSFYSSATTTSSATIISGRFFISIFSYIETLLSLFTFNSFSKLTSDDFSGDTRSWTYRVIGSSDSYLFPSSTSQAWLRVHENVKRFPRNYASLFILFFVCSVYQMPLALAGMISCLALWYLFGYWGDRWGLDRYPLFQLNLVRVAQCCEFVHLLLLHFP
ncbi:unnamed protein product [Ilex paraguariensis]|uniref:PRA1 family protein n=1 Tax=Ilex paraguariensis TaxID=185542 RepID=A0ABC8U0G1_9AQUA